MSAARFGRLQKATALVPLALLSTAWTASLAGVGTASAEDKQAPSTPEVSVPFQAIDDPASYSTPDSIGLGVPKGQGDEIVQTASRNGIPAAALAAYQRAETVINAADTACAIPWELLAAIGRVESDHGRYGNNTLDIHGVSRPGIYGIPLDGSHGTQEITDTDAGEYDKDDVYDRAVGPMQFIPSTWSVVGVDADGDAKRNPQDIDDAALAAAVYLCSGDDDLSTDAGQRSAVYRYNHSQEYVDLVLSVMAAYMEGDYSAVPNYVTSAVTFTPDYSYTSPQPGKTKKGGKSGGSNTGSNTGGTPTTGGETPGGEDPTGPLPGGGDDDPVKTIEETVKEVTAPVIKVLSAAEALTLCSEQFAAIPDPLHLLDGAKQSCANKVEGKTESAALDLIPNTLAGILNWLGL